MNEREIPACFFILIYGIPYPYEKKPNTKNIDLRPRRPAQLKGKNMNIKKMKKNIFI